MNMTKTKTRTKTMTKTKDNLQNVQDISEHFLILWTKIWTKTLTKTKTRTNNLSLGLDSNSSLMELDAADLHLVIQF